MPGDNKFVPVVIIGAPRSGTNMLRDVLCCFEGVATWPCDEINSIWRHGNVFYPDDQIPASKMTPSIRRFIRSRFYWVARRYSAATVVEKTCANSLRVDLVDKVMPEARYIYIVRDGIDAVGSAKLRWKADFDLTYTLKKARFVPIGDLPIYLFRFLGSRLYRLFGKSNRLAFWGPIFPRLDDALKHHDLVSVCALQWKTCVDRSDECFANIDSSRVHKLRYEDFVADPQTKLKDVLNFAGIAAERDDILAAVKGVSDSSLGKGRRQLGSRQIEMLENLLSDTLSRHGY